MLIKILIGLGAVLVVFLTAVAFRPADFRVEREATLSAPADLLFEHVNDQRKFCRWNPFMKLDPNVAVSYSGPEAGVGSVCAWNGNKDIGEGSATIIESKVGELVRIRMDWKRPMVGVATVDFTFKPEGDSTTVKWAMYGKNNYVAKLFSLFFDCDKMCGPQFEKGLAELGKIAAEERWQFAGAR